MKKNLNTMLRLKSRIKILKEKTGSLDAKEIASNMLSKYENADIAESYLSEFEKFISTEIVEQLKDIKDDEVEKFVLREKRLLAIQNLGVKSSIKKIKENEIYNYPTVKYFIQNIKQIETAPEFLVVEYFMDRLQPYLWDKTINECYLSIKEKAEELSEDIALNKAIIDFENSSSDYLLKAFENELDDYVVNRNDATRIKLLEKLEEYRFDSHIRTLSNILKEHTGTFQLKSTEGQNKVENIYSPIMIIENFDVFYSSGNYMKRDGDLVEKLTTEEVAKLPANFTNLCEFLNCGTSAITENKVTVYSRDKKVEIVQEGEEIIIYVNENKVSLQNFNKIFMNSGIFHADENTVMNNVYQVIEHFNSIANIDYAKRISSTVLDGHWVDLISVDEKIYTIKFDARNRINEFAELNALQTREMVYEFMQYDIAESFRDLISKDESIVKKLEDGRKEILEAIDYLEDKKAQVTTAINESADLKENAEIQEVINGITKEVEGLKKSYGELSSQIENLTSSESKKTEKKEECDDADSKKDEEDLEEKKTEKKVNEDHIPAGAKVKCKESGKTGTVQSWDDKEEQYIVLMDGGNDTVEYKDGDIEVIKELGKEVNEGDTKAGTEVKLKDGSTGTVQSWKEATGVYIVLLDGGNETIEVPDGEFEVIKEIGEELKTSLTDNQKMSIDIMMGKELTADDIIKIVNSSNDEVDHSVEILAYMKDAKGPEKSDGNAEELQEEKKKDDKEDKDPDKDPDKVNLEKKEGEQKKEPENEEKETPLKAGDKVKLKNNVIGTVQSINDSSGEAIVNMDDGNTVAIPEDKFGEVEIIKKKSKEENPEVKNKEKSNTDGESSEVQEKNTEQDWIDGEIVNGKDKGKKIKINALEFTSGGDKDKISVKIGDNESKMMKSDLKV